MEINLSNEMVEKIATISFARVRELKRKIAVAEVNQKEATNSKESLQKRFLINDLNKDLKDAKEVHRVFLELLEEIEEGE